MLYSTEPPKMDDIKSNILWIKTPIQTLGIVITENDEKIINIISNKGYLHKNLYLTFGNKENKETSH